jgi:hypothetical protein
MVVGNYLRASINIKRNVNDAVEEMLNGAKKEKGGSDSKETFAKILLLP